MKNRTTLISMIVTLLTVSGSGILLCQSTHEGTNIARQKLPPSDFALEPANIFLAKIKKGKAGVRSLDVVNNLHVSASSGVLLYGAVGGTYAPTDREETAEADKGVKTDGVDLGLPTEFALFQNFPNPFNPSAVIRYALPAQSAVTLKVYDVMGREVATLLNGEVQAPGYRSVVLDGSKLASGVYFYRLDAGSFTDIKKMTLIK